MDNSKKKTPMAKELRYGVGIIGIVVVAVAGLGFYGMLRKPEPARKLLPSPQVTEEHRALVREYFDFQIQGRNIDHCFCDPRNSIDFVGVDSYKIVSATTDGGFVKFTVNVKSIKQDGHFHTQDWYLLVRKKGFGWCIDKVYGDLK